MTLDGVTYICQVSPARARCVVTSNIDSALFGDPSTHDAVNRCTFGSSNHENVSKSAAATTVNCEVCSSVDVLTVRATIPFAVSAVNTVIDEISAADAPSNVRMQAVRSHPVATVVVRSAAPLNRRVSFTSPDGSTHRM